MELHHRKAKKAREQMKTDHEDSTLVTSDTCTISVDLQQVFSLPAISHCQVYYLRQLSCFNMGLHMADNNQGFMFVWHEGMSGRGGNEIASCILREISKVSQVKVMKNTPITIFTKKTFSEVETWKQTNIFKKGVKKEDIQGLELPRLETEGRIKPEMKEDLRKFLPYLKEENKLFYQELLAE
ncbi:hypothetical protein J6590_071924 [Homalodisca vitripennis]|nr:hypothetical protein J6590_071924 [Homalodisca vitripennis]